MLIEVVILENSTRNLIAHTVEVDDFNAYLWLILLLDEN